MFKNYFKTAYRSLIANKSYSLITIAGLGVGIAVCLVIFVFIRYEESFENFHRNKARIYRVMTKNEKGEVGAAIPWPLPGAIHNDLPNLTSTGIYLFRDEQILVLNKAGQTEKKFKEAASVFLVEPSFFSIFDFPWLAGDPASALGSPDVIALTRSTAEKYFGDWKQAMGRSLKLNGRQLVKVTGILEDLPSNTDFADLKMVLAYPLKALAQRKDWWTIDGDHHDFVMLPPNESPATVNRQLATLSKKYRTADNKNTQLLESLENAHYNSTGGNYGGKTITHERISSLWLIAAFILIIACVNFINLSTAQAINRAREVGVRKVLGSNRGQLTRQFLLEALLLVAMGVGLAIGLTTLLLGPIGKVLDIPLSVGFFGQTAVLLFLLGTTGAVTLLAGFYPALVLSSFNPITALKSKLSSTGKGGVSLRRALVVCQFVIAQALIIGTLFLIKQMNYFNSIPMGFSKDAVVSVSFPGDSLGRSKTSWLRDQLMALKNVRQVTFNNTPPASEDNWWTPFKFDHDPKEVRFASIQKWIDANYLETYSLPLVAGRNVTTSDSIKEFLVNETVVRKLGFKNPADVLNKEINLWRGFAVGPIVGVVKDFHQSSLRDSVSPVFMLNFKKGVNTAGIKITSMDMPATLHAIEKIWNTTYPDYFFDYQFMDEKIAGFYKGERQTSQLYTIFASIAIFLSCLGLYGLASFMTTQRIKEVGIRKVLGATSGHIVYLFSREFLLLIGIAFVLAAPIAWYFVHKWLEQFIYRTTISWWIFLVGGVAALLIALITVSSQAIKAAMTNPVKNLRAE